MTDGRRYSVRAICNNCGQTGKISVSHGVPLSCVTCPECGCTCLERLPSADMQQDLLDQQKREASKEDPWSHGITTPFTEK